MMPKACFADTAFLIARLNPRDNHHQKARALTAELKGSRLITSEMIFTELLDAFAESGSHVREAACQLVKSLRGANSRTHIVEQTGELFQKALQKHQNFSDKEWGLTDCASFVIMEENAITHALTTDHHFEQGGFIALMKEQ